MADWSHPGASYNAPYQSPYVNQPSSYVHAAPPPAPMPSQYDYPQSPDIRYAEPGSPIVYPVSPVGSPPRSRDSSRPRPSSFGGEPFIGVPDGGRERMYHTSHLIVGPSSQALSRSASERSRPRRRAPAEVDYIDVVKTGTSNRGRPGRSGSVNYYYDGRDGGKKYTHNAAGSTYSNSSYGSRSHSRVRHSRSPSCDSCGSGCEEDHAVTTRSGAVVIHSANNQGNALAEQLRMVQMELEKVRLEKETKLKEEEEHKHREVAVQARVRETLAEQKQREQAERARNSEIERKVAEQLAARSAKEQAEKAAKEAERARITQEAEKLLRERQAAEERKRAEEAANEEKMRLIVEERIKKMQPPPPPQPAARLTYTKFSKVHLCKEALDERNIGYTEESEHFLVHRVVDKNEQNYLWARTKEIRSYYRQIQEAADRAPTVRTQEGAYVKYVQIAGQPHPIALPVTFTQTPGGGQTQRVDPIKIKWSDIFKPSKF